MADEVDLVSRLGSPLYGAMLHVLGVTAPAVDAACAAARVYSRERAPHASCVQSLCSELSAEQRAALEAWPHQPGSLFDVMAPRGPREGVFRPSELLSETESPEQLFQPVLAFIPVVDAACVAVRLEDQAWALAVLLRCGRQPPMGQEHSQLQQLLPDIGMVLRSGFEREMRPLRRPGSHGRAMSLEEAMVRLTRSERQILHLLRSAITERKIAENIARSPHTVHVHVKNIYRKLGVGSRRELDELLSHRRGEQ